RGGRATARGTDSRAKPSSALVAETSPRDRDFPPFRQGERVRRRESRLGPLRPPTRLAPSKEVPDSGPRVSPPVLDRGRTRGRMRGVTRQLAVSMGCVLSLGLLGAAPAPVATSGPA